MAKILTYTVVGFLPFEYREVEAGDLLDIPITAQVEGVPDFIRGVVQTVTSSEVNLQEGRVYEIQYDEEDLGGYLLELDQCCHVGVPTAVSCLTLLDEHIAQSPLLNSQDTVATSRVKLSVTKEGLKVAKSGTRNRFVSASLLFAELGIAQPEEYSYKMVVEATATSYEAVNGVDSTASFVFVGQTNVGGSVHKTYENVQIGESFSAFRVGEGLYVNFVNSASSDKHFWLEVTFSISKIPN